jgi:hypothetical protein
LEPDRRWSGFSTTVRTALTLAQVKQALLV